MILVIAILPVAKKEEAIVKENKTTQKKEKTYNLRFGHNIPTSSTLHQTAEIYAQKVFEKTNGKVKIDIFPAQKLGNDHQMVEMTRKGELDIILTPTAKMSVPMPSIQYVDLPFYFPTKEDLYTLLDGEVGKILLQNLINIDLIGVTFWGNGFKHFTAHYPLEKLEDFKDKKFRIMKSKLIKDQFNTLESDAVPIDFHATKEALKNRVVDGQENPLIAIVSMGFHEVQSNLTVSNHAYLGYVFSISSKVFATLPTDIQNVLITTARELTDYEREQTQKKEDLLLQEVKAKNVNIHVLTSEEKNRITQKMTNISKKYEDVIGSDIISKTEEYFIEKYKDSDDYVYLGLDADLSMGAKVSGLAIKRGIELALEEINQNGGLLGKKVLLISRDHKARSNRSKKNIQYFKEKDRVIGLIGGLHSAVIASGLEEIKASNIPFMVPWAAAPILTEDTNSNIFRVSANDKYASEFILDSALQKSDKLAILVENSVWGRSSLAIMKKALNKHNKKFLYIKEFNRGHKSFDSDFEKIKNSGANTIIMVANPIEGGKIAAEAAALDTAPTIFSHWGIIGGDFFNKHKNSIEKTNLQFIQSFSFLDNKKDESIQLANKYKNKYSVSSKDMIKAPAGVAQAYDATKILALAIKQANSFDHKKVKNELENINHYEGAIKTYNKPFSNKNHDALEKKDFFMAKFGENGLIIKVK